MSGIPPTIEKLFPLAVENNASDIHLKTGRPALLRISSQLVEAEMAPFTADQILAFIEATMPARFKERWVRDNQVDYSFMASVGGGTRFRVNAYLQRNDPAVVMRLVKQTPPSFADLGLDGKTFMRAIESMEGMVVICGATGSGKSSTLAAMLREVNENSPLHVVTLENPIEYIFKDDKCSFSQREVGIDVESFPSGLHAALRQDPDIVLVGEMRDRETFETALHAAETGHLVLSTLHAGTAQQAVQRLFEFYPPEQLTMAKRNIAACLKAVVVQTLVPKIGGGVAPADEIFIIDSTARRIIAEGQFEKIPDLVNASADAGSRSMNSDLNQLVRSGKVSRADALARSPNPKQLEMILSGINIAASGIIR